MKHTLESYLDRHRDHLDVPLPEEDQLWEGISARLNTRQQRNHWLRKAAAIFLLLVSVSSLTIYSVNRSLHQPAQGITLSDISRELAAEEEAFRQSVYAKMEEIRLQELPPELSFTLFQELHQIDLQYDAYLADLQILGDNPKVVLGLIRCYEQKIKILEKTLRESEKTKRHETKNQ